MAIDKTKGQTLYFSQWGGERPIPDVFVAAMERAETRQTGWPKDAEIPQDVKVDVDVVDAFFDTRERNTNEKTLVVVRKKAGNITLRDFRTTDQGQTVQVDATLFYTTDSAFAHSYPTATQDVAVKDLGNRWSIQEVAVSGTWVDGVFTAGIFQGIELTTRRDDPVPDEFRLALEAEEVQSIVQGTVAQPTLTTDDLEAKERQITQHKKLLTRLTREGVTLPFTLVNKETNNKKQLVVVSKTYRVVGTAPTVTSTQDVKVLDLGEGHEVVTTELAPALFGAEKYTKEILDLFPEKFRGLIPKTTSANIVGGTATMPSLGIGELMRSEQQITVLTKLVEVATRFSAPIVITDTAVITEYGGGKVTINQTIDLEGLATVDEGEEVVNSRITNLGNGYELKESITRVAGAWPVLQFSEFSGRLQTVVKGTKQVVAKGSTRAANLEGLSGSDYTTVRDIDGYREWRIITTQPLTAVDAYVRKLYGNSTNLNLPPELTALTGYIDRNGGAGSYSQNGTYILGGTYGGGSIQLHGTAQASSSALPELGYSVILPKTNNVPCIHVIFYVANSTNRASIITALATAFGSAVTDWPDFRPQRVVVVSFGGKASFNVAVEASAHDSVTTDYLGALKFNGSSRHTGAGGSIDVARITRVIQIPETIHGALTVTNESDLWTDYYGARGTITSGVNSIDTDAVLSIVAVRSRGNFVISSGAAATTPASYSGLSGYYVHRLVSEPDPEFNRTRVFAEIVYANDFKP